MLLSARLRACVRASFAALALLYGCGGPQFGVDGTALRPAHLHKNTSQPLLYVVGSQGVYELSYPSGKLIQTITAPYWPQGVCSDTAGDVFITAYQDEAVFEYAHGGTKPIAKLEDFGYYPNGCAVDPLTGDLAVANVRAMDSSAGNVAIYSGGKGKPTFYTAPGMSNYFWCTYDTAGNLFVDGEGTAGLAEMPAGSGSFIDLSTTVGGQGMQWDGQYLVLVDPGSKALYQLQISGSTATLVGTVPIKGLVGVIGSDFTFDGTTLILPYGVKQDVTRIGLWKYPKGGAYVKRLHFKGYNLTAIALSD